MNARIQQLKKDVEVDHYPLCVEKARLMTESYRCTEGEPEVVRRAKALAHTLSNIPIFIKDGELVVGNAASTFMGVEIDSVTGPGRNRKYGPFKERDGSSVTNRWRKSRT
jgi:formate C-acetyltransferase